MLNYSVLVNNSKLIYKFQFKLQYYEC